MNILRVMAALIALSFGTALSFADNTALSGATDDLVITSISVAGTNLVLNARIPAGVEEVTLEMCPALNAVWEEQGRLEVQAGMVELAFTIPKPTNSTAFFRLKGKTHESAPVLSDQVRYVAMPSLELNRGTNGEAIFHFKGQVDGSDKITITRDGALWSHVHWGWPADAVAINGTRWNPEEKNFLTTPGVASFLPEAFSLDSARLEVMNARDVVALERATNALIVYLDDTLRGADEYEFAIHFEREKAKPQRAAGAAVRLKISARIDGSDRIKITQREATWEHKAWAEPTEVTINDIPWPVQETPILRNEGDHEFLPAGVALSSARIIGRKGRDLATMWADKDAVWLCFADNPNSGDDYELVIAFGK